MRKDHPLLPGKENDRQLRKGTRIIAALALLWYLAFIARSGFRVGDVTYFTLFDDAMIAMRYARNLAGGYGLVWNAGEYVEGYTNFLWTLWMAFIHLFGIPDSKTSLFVSLSGAVILLVNIRVIRAITMEFTRNLWIIFSAMTLVAFNFGLIYWTLRGMEVGIITLGLNYTVLLALRLRRRYSLKLLLQAALVPGLMLLTRTDCLLLYLVTSAWIVYILDRGRRLQAVLLFTATLLLFLGGHTLFRTIYYHDPLPNTFYLKVGGTPVGVRILRGLTVYVSWLTSFFIPAVLVFITGIFTRLRTLKDPAFLLLAAPFLVMSAYSVYVGGDAWEWMPYANRYITLAIPLFLVFCLLLLEMVLKRRQATLLLLVLTAFFVAGWYLYIAFLLPQPGNTLSGFYPTVIRLRDSLLTPISVLVFMLTAIALTLLIRSGHARKHRVFANGVILHAAILLFLSLEGLAYIHWFRYNALHMIDDRKMVITGLNVRSLTTPDTKIAVVWGGAIPYFSHRYTVDLMGKMDRTIAKSNSRMKEFFPGHTKWNYGYSVYRYQPDLVLQLFYKTTSDDQCIVSQGYDHISGDLFVRSGSYDKILLPGAKKNPAKLYELMICR